ncbi:hypothetical protein DL96DRAFT_1815047 [Flagelloscypha sp. PMI_526]|nr:hypothetical protein DL96DRAFT_1815047 [Flagelloscypha sp. PMI_526]
MNLSAEALASLSTSQHSFLYNLPKAELHAHLNGSIPLDELRALALEYQRTSASAPSTEAIQNGIQKILDGVELKEIHDFFDLFPAIYALTSTPTTLTRMTRAVLGAFLEPPALPTTDGNPLAQAAYLELRTTPRASPEGGIRDRTHYVEIVLDEVERYGSDRAALILSTDRRWKDEKDIKEVVDIAIAMKNKGRRVVGVDLCGPPTMGDLSMFELHFRRVKEAGLGITLHISETTENTAEDSSKLLSFQPDRLGHATFLNEEHRQHVGEKKCCVEMCLSSNLLCKTVPQLHDHHIKYYLEKNFPVSICTDDTLIFQSTLTQEYALLLAKPPLGLGLSEEKVERLARDGMEARFRQTL